MKENQHTEWKVSWRDEYLKWICSFANAQGGCLEIGRDDDGMVVGVPDAEKLIEDLPNKIRDALGVMATVNLRTVGALEYVEIDVDPYPYPISYKGRYYVRSGATKQELKGAALDKFLLGKQGKHWDGVPVPHTDVNMLDSQALESFRQRAMQSKRMAIRDLRETASSLLDKLKLCDGHGLKRAALLLFHPDPEEYVTGAYIKIGYFQNDAVLLYHDEVHGPLMSQVDEASSLILTKYMKAAISYEGAQRIERYPIPEEALLEAILNAVAHKDYSSGVPIQISVYADRIMLWNSGQLPHDWTTANLFEKHASLPHNPDVANALFRAGMIEAWGRGIERIVDSCRIAGIPPPELRDDHTGLWVVLRFAEHIHGSVGRSSGTGQETSQETGQETSQETGQETGQGRTRDRVLSLLSERPEITRRELAALLGISSNGARYHLEKLKAEGLVRRVGSTKAGHWEVGGTEIGSRKSEVGSQKSEVRGRRSEVGWRRRSGG